VSYLRKGSSTQETVLVVCNFTPIAHPEYRVGVPAGGPWKELLNSDAKEYGGHGLGNLGSVEAVAQPLHGRSHSLRLTLPPLGVLVFKRNI
jgi:1,4-alpha-glucan branching enzyme